MGTRVFIGGLKDPRLRERDVEDFFRGYGRIREVVLKPGYGFVEFEDLRDAEDAVYEKNGKSLNGERVVVEHAMRPGTNRRQRQRSPVFRSRAPLPSRSKYRVQVENISSRASWRDVKALMQKAGEVTFCDAHRHITGEGHCEFETREGMEKAIDELNGKELHGKRLKLTEAKSRSRSPRRRRSRSRSPRRRSNDRKSASRSKSRSKSRSPDRSRKDKEDKADDKKDKSRSRSRSRSNSRPKSRASKASRSPAPAKKGGRKSRSRSRSRSRSASPAKQRNKSRSASPSRRNGK